MDSVLVRPATLADAPRMAVLSGQLGYPAETADLGARLGNLLNRGDDEGVFVAEVGGQVVGWAHVTARFLLESAAYVELAGLVVDAALRRQGIGGRLLQISAAWAQDKGFRQMRVRSNVVREDAHRFYEGAGFAKTKTQSVFVMGLPAGGSACPNP